MKLCTHADIPVGKLRPLQKAVDVAEAVFADFNSVVADRNKAAKQVPQESEAPKDKAKRPAWERKREARLEKVAVSQSAVAAVLQPLTRANQALRTAIEDFRSFGTGLYEKSDSEAARMAALNVLRTDQLCAEIEDAAHAETPREPSFEEKLLVRQRFLANQRHYTVRSRVHSANWSWMQNRNGGWDANPPAAPCMTYAEAERRCQEVGQNLAQKMSQMGYEVQCYDLVNKRQVGTAVVCSHADMPRAQD
jgi:hypothetical protein